MKNIPYGHLWNEKTSAIEVHPFEPFGYRAFFGCNYFKFGLYTDKISEPWTILIDRFRRACNESAWAASRTFSTRSVPMLGMSA